MTTRPIPSIISEVPVTYGELIEVLTQLGYQQESDGKDNRFTNVKYNSFLILPVSPLDRTVEKFYLAAYSSRLYLQGVIKEEENLIRKIQKNRLKKSKKVSNKEPMPV